MQALQILEDGNGLRLDDPPPIVPSPDPNEVVLRYRLEASDLPMGEQRIHCRFAAPGADAHPLELAALRTERSGELSAAALFFLDRYVLKHVSLQGFAPPAGPLAYLLQQLANAVAPAAIYALLATGYALIYGITGRLNLAFGDFTTVGAFAAVNGLVLAGLTSLAVLPASASLGLAFATATGAALGFVLHALVFAPLQRRSSQALLIATIGLAIVTSEGLRLLGRSRQIWLPPFLEQPLDILPTDVTVSLGQTVLALLAALTVGGVLVLLRRTAFGRCYRACADDVEAAALVGVDTDRTLRLACVLGSAVAGVAGFVVAMRYGIVTFGMGTTWGFKALAAAIIGGIGSVSGAALGGVLVGLLEGLWAGYLPGVYREIALFALLALMLAIRPHGLFGAPTAAENPMLWRSG